MALGRSMPGMGPPYSIVNEFLKISKHNLGSERRMPQVLQEEIETVGLKVNGDVVFLRNTAQGV